jgi:hypothetical protein
MGTMKVRQALKIRKRMMDKLYRKSTVRAARKSWKQNRHRFAKMKNILVGSLVIINTNTAFDEEGVPVNVGRGGCGYVMEIDGFPQVLCNTSMGLDVVGIPAEHLRLQ